MALAVAAKTFCVAVDRLARASALFRDKPPVPLYVFTDTAKNIRTAPPSERRHRENPAAASWFQKRREQQHAAAKRSVATDCGVDRRRTPCSPDGSSHSSRATVKAAASRTAPATSLGMRRDATVQAMAAVRGHDEVSVREAMRLAKSTPARPEKRRTEAGRTQQAARFAAPSRAAPEGCARAAARSPSESAPFRSRVDRTGDDGGVSDLLRPSRTRCARLSCSGGAAFPSLRAARGAYPRGRPRAPVPRTSRGVVHLRQRFPVRVRFGVRHRHSPLDGAKRFCARCRGARPRACPACRAPPTHSPAREPARAPHAARPRSMPASSCERPAFRMPAPRASAPHAGRNGVFALHYRNDRQACAAQYGMAGCREREHAQPALPPSNRTLSVPLLSPCARP